MQLTLKQDPTFYDKSKDGKPLTYVSKKTTKTMSYKRVVIKVVEYEKPLSGAVFTNDSPINTWKGGQMIDVEVKQNGEYLNFELPRKEGAFNLAPRITAIEERLKDIEDWIQTQVVTPDQGLREDEIDELQIPF